MEETITNNKMLHFIVKKSGAKFILHLAQNIADIIPQEWLAVFLS
jgi:hypothetical protein